MGTPATQSRTDISPLAHVRRVVRASRTSFLWGMRVLPRERRHAMYAVYAFCREVDDIVDRPGDPASKIRALDAWRAEIARVYDGIPARPTSRALSAAVAKYRLPKSEFLAVIDGMAMDARDNVRMETMDDLLLYCRRVAGAVGILCVHVFGYGQPSGPAIAERLGNAFQLTNILRDLKEDLSIGRLYVPLSVLRSYGVPTSPIQSVFLHAGFSRACEELTETARDFYAEADRMMAAVERRHLRPAAIMRANYRSLFEQLVRRGFRELDRPVRLSRSLKLWNAVRWGIL